MNLRNKRILRTKRIKRTILTECLSTLKTKRIKRTTTVMKRRWMKKLRTKRIKRTTTGKFAVSLSQCC